MRLSRVIFAGIVALSLAGCGEDPVSKQIAPEPSAAIRWINAVPDTVAMDYRIVDYPSNASEPALAFQSVSGNWRIIPAGTHQVKAFFFCSAALAGLSWCADAGVVSQVVDEATLNLGVDKKYTILHYGFAKAGSTPQKSLQVIEDVLPTVPAGQVAIRVINAAPAFGSINVYASTATATGGAVTGIPAFTSVAPGAATPWVNFPVATGSSSYRFAATSTTATTVLADFLATPGVAATAATATTGALDAVPGTRQAGSALTIVVFGPRVAYTLRSPSGATTPVAGTTTGAMANVADVWPARISP
jgi:hypothetical protein